MFKWFSAPKVEIKEPEPQKEYVEPFVVFNWKRKGPITYDDLVKHFGSITNAFIDYVDQKEPITRQDMLSKWAIHELMFEINELKEKIKDLDKEGV